MNPGNFIKIFFFRFYFYLLKRHSYREREGETERDLPTIRLFPKWPQWLGLRLAEARNQEHLLGRSHGCWGPNTWAMLCCSLKCISKELERKWSSQNMNWCPRDVLVLQVVALPDLPQYHSKLSVPYWDALLACQVYSLHYFFPLNLASTLTATVSHLHSFLYRQNPPSSWSLLTYSVTTKGLE